MTDQATKKQMCTVCGKRQAMHESFFPATGVETHLCCQCNALDETSEPADWHPGCVAAWNAAEQKRNKSVVSVKWVPTMERKKRGGLFGQLLDLFWPIYIPVPGGSRFVAKAKDGTIITSKDGVSWTPRRKDEKR